MKRVLCALLALILVLSVSMTASASSVDVTDEGKTVITYGDWIMEKINGDTQWNLDSYIGEDTAIVAPRIISDMMVISFGDYCFANNVTLQSVTTSSPLWIVGEYAFNNCTALKYFECNYAMTTIKTGAFSGTSSLKSINLEDSAVAEIQPYVFLNSGLESIRLPETCTKLDIYSFAQCYNLSKIVIPDSVTEIADTAFDACDSLVIYCTTDSYAHQYAVANEIDYVLVDVPVEYTYVLGDADGDGRVTILDATKIQRLLVSLVDDPDGMIALRSDSNGNGLDILDATRIQRYRAGFTVEAAIGESATAMVPLAY